MKNMIEDLNKLYGIAKEEEVFKPELAFFGIRKAARKGKLLYSVSSKVKVTDENIDLVENFCQDSGLEYKCDPEVGAIIFYGWGVSPEEGSKLALVLIESLRTEMRR